MSQVYFLFAPSVNLMKIGRSVDPERRFQELRLLSPVQLEVVGVVDGGSSVESDFHRQFSHLHSHGEWFHATKELRDFASVKTLVAAWEKARPEARERFLADIGAVLDTPVFDRGRAA